ncbi:receptor-like protein kinase FERONIA [Salvia divinorum]|uniref:Receptor-like protein kinase FERONIA n=1 Tax=Salvia divinorum TaxID=28513 RepID=A0ABD1HDR6_SALDI
MRFWNMKPHRLIVIWFFVLYRFIAAAADPNHISINCSSDDREWLGNSAAADGSSGSSAAMREVVVTC